MDLLRNVSQRHHMELRLNSLLLWTTNDDIPLMLNRYVWMYLCMCLYIYVCVFAMYTYAHTFVFLYTYVCLCVYAQGYNDSDDDNVSIGAISVASTYLDIISTSGSINGDKSESSLSVTGSQSPKKQQSTQKKKRSPNYRGMYAYLASLIRAQVREEMDREKNLLSIDIQESKDKVLSSLMTAFVVEG